MKNYKIPCLLVPVHLVGCLPHTPVQRSPSLPATTQKDDCLSAPVKATPAQMPTLPYRQDPVTTISVTMQGLRLVHRQTLQASHIEGCSRRGGRAGERPPSSGQWGAQVVPQGCDTRRSRPVRALHAVFPGALAEPDALPWRQVLFTAPQPFGSGPQQPAGPLSHAVKTLPSPPSYHPIPARIVQPRARPGLGPGRAAQDRPRRGP